MYETMSCKRNDVIRSIIRLLLKTTIEVQLALSIITTDLE